mmetsp:Transcript_49943/g.63981  ORF Transcript_49943/g.63981 Transcript_49943/m.63981 type:complete len:400 (+) Transcript_49943:24-1223(+)
MASPFLYAFLFFSTSTLAHDLPCVPHINRKLSNGVQMPRVSFGTAGLPRGEAQENIINLALKTGFRSFDTAQAREWYDEESVAKSLVSSDIDFKELFITTKIHPRDLGYENTMKAVETSIQLFNGNPIDLILLHYSKCFIGVCTKNEILKTEAAGGWKSSWVALNELVKAGKVRAIGVSNFHISELQQMNPLPHMVQNWFDPFHQDRDVLSWCADNNIGYTSYSTLGGQWAHQEVEGEGKRRLSNPLFENPILKDIANHHGGENKITDVVLSWALQRNVFVLPRSSSKHHIQSNAKFVSKNKNSLHKNNEDNVENNEVVDETEVETVPILLNQKELELIDSLDGSIDRHVECFHWAQAGECDHNPGFMHQSCQSSCRLSQAIPLTCSGKPINSDFEEEL